ncbi:MAG: spermidine synthase, partial [Caldilineae bacterium]
MRRTAPLLILFFLSGVSALIYQVTWVRQATLVFGVSVYAYSAVLAAFMGGTALGSIWAAGRVDDHRHPLRLYGLLQAGIALFGLVSPFLLVALMPVYASAAHAMDLDSPLVTALRALFSILVLVPPTFLMGATLPAMARAYAHTRGRVGSDVGKLYAADTLGAALGCGLTGLFLLRLLGTQQTIFLAAGLNIVAAAGAILLARRLGPTTAPSAPAAVPVARSKQKRTRTAGERSTARLSPAFILGAYAVSGFAALGYEVVWAR